MITKVYFQHGVVHSKWGLVYKLFICYTSYKKDTISKSHNHKNLKNSGKELNLINIKFFL
jgi:hypothetical protein